MRLPWTKILLSIWFLCGLARPLCAGQSQTPEDVLNSTYKGKVVVLHNFYSGSHLVYSADGSLLKGGHTGPWTLDADVQVDAIHLKRSKMTIEGNRAWVAFVSGGQKLFRADEVTIDVEVKHDPITLSDILPVFDKIFLTPEEKFANFVPDYWKSFLAPGKPDASKPADAPSSDQLIELLNSKQGVIAPRPVNTPEPIYTDAARNIGLEGTAIFVMTLGVDGRVHHVDVSRPLGLGLDDEAAETLLRDWKFQPAAKNGKPVPTRITVQISFRLRN